MGFPKGDPSLAYSASYYDTLYREGRLFGDVPATVAWRSLAARIVTWYPALALLQNAPVFDVGCGPGIFAEMCCDYGVAYRGGVDVSPTAITLAQERLPGWADRFADAHAQVIPNIVASQPIGATAFVFLEVLEHVYDDLALLQAVPKGGTIIASVPSFHTDGHCRWFTTDEEVRERYGSVMTIERVVVESHQSSNWWYIWKGKRR